MSALVCIDFKKAELRRYDTTRDEGLTHIGYFAGGALAIDACVEEFRLNPPDCLAARPHLEAVAREKREQSRILELVGELMALGVTDLRQVQRPAFKLLPAPDVA